MLKTIAQLCLLQQTDSSEILHEGIVPNWRTNNMADLQETKFLRIFGLELCIISASVPRCDCIYLCVNSNSGTPSVMTCISLLHAL
jgi:hypothetical protein